MTINIHVDLDNHIFHLKNDNMSYIIEIVNNNYLKHCYWGHALNSYNKLNKAKMSKRTFAAFSDINNPDFSLEFLPQEFPIDYQGDYKNPAIKVTLSDGSDIIRLNYDSYEIINDAIILNELPHARKNDTDSAKTLIINLIDNIAKIKVQLFYTIFEHTDVIVRSSKIFNIGNAPFTLNHLVSASFDLPYQNQLCHSFFGSHQDEFQIQCQKISHGQFKIGTSRGASGPQYPPYLAISSNATEFFGDVHGMTLIYSGNHTELIERDQYDQLRLQIGLNPDQFSWILQPNQSFQTPQAVLSYSPNGLNGLAQNFHKFTKDHLINPVFRKKSSPILINSWEMTYYDVNEKLMLGIINRASELGFEAVVLDDGWFKGRTSSKSSLGDWKVDKAKFPNSLFNIIKEAHQKNLKFGIWFEPEMISPNSELYKNHPDWVVKSPKYDCFFSRSQWVLDLTQKDVQNYIISTLTNFINTYSIDYIKWDMNRHIVENESQLKNNQHSKAFSHLYMLGLYRIINQLTKTFPEVLFENCSSGGGRLDYGMLYYFPQTWASDNTDGLNRQFIQYGASYLFHPYLLTGHVSAIPNHQTMRSTPLKSRMNLASSTNMGYELDILNLNNDEEKYISNHIKEYKSERDTLQNSNFYRIISPFDSNICSWMFKTQTESIVYIFRNLNKVTRRYEILKIPYLDVDSDYYISELDLVISGSELAFSGIYVEFPNNDWESCKYHIKKMSN